MSASASLIVERTTLTLADLCNSILGTSDGIQFVAVINKKGRVIEKKSRDDNSHLTSNQKNEMYFMQCALQMSMANEFNEELGTIEYVLTERENSKFVLISYFSYIILVVMKKNTDHTTVITKIEETVTKFENLGKQFSIGG